MGIPKDHSGEQYGYLTAKSITNERRGKDTIWLFSCKCGKECKKVISDVINDAKKGRTPSCGCLYKGHRVKAATKHGLSRISMYHIWQGMKQRCYDKNTLQYKRYGARGITVCDKWLNSFKAFYDDMQSGYKHGLQIDRIDNDKGYSPDNCRWVTCKTNCRNKRNNHIAFGMTITELSELTGIKRGTLYARARKGYKDENLINPIKE